MSEYRALRERYSLLDLCRTPDLATQVTLQPVRRIEVDAAILFSDLLLPLEPMGIAFDFVHGEGPAIETPLRTEADLGRVRRFEPRESLKHVLDAIRQTQRELAGRVPLIGFAGAPLTMLTYAVEGGFFEVPVFSSKIVDRVGAGDAYFSIAAPCVAAGLPMDLVGFIGNAVGALAVRIVGNRSAVEPVPLYKFITALLK